MKMKKLFALTMSAAMLLNLAACGTKSADNGKSVVKNASKQEASVSASNDKSSSVTSSTTDKESDTITICTTNDPGKQAAWTAVAEAYMKIHPEIKVVVDLKASENYDQWVQTEFTSSSPTADIVNINLAGDTNKGKSINYMEYFDNKSPYSDGTWGEQFNVSKQKVNMADNTMDALCLDTVQVIWLYNADIFKKAGAKPPKTWDELIEACKKIQAKGYQPIACDGDYNSFYALTMGWLAQIYHDQTNRSEVNITRAQEGDYCYDPDVDGKWKYNPSDPNNDDPDRLTQNPVRAFASIKDGTRSGNTDGFKAVWKNLAKVYPKYAGGNSFFGTNFNGSKALFYQGKAAMMVNVASGIVEFNNDMKTLDSGKDVQDSEGKVINNIKKFKLGTFNMPSMEGKEFEAKARTIEVANGFIGCISKGQAHDDKVVDFLMYFSSSDGQSAYIDAGLDNGMVPAGQSLVYNVKYPEEIQSAFDSLELIGNVQKDFNNQLARGIGESADNFRNFYEYSYDYLTGKIDINTWAKKHQDNIMSHFDKAMTEKGVGKNDLAHPQNKPTGN